MKQQVINYECDVLQKQSHPNQSIFRINDSFHHRYGSWRLQQTIQKYVSNVQHSIKWIGCDPFSHALSLFYCMLVGSLQNDQESQDLYIKLKYSLYQECKQSLSISEQKILIQHLGLIEDSKNIGQFLKKSCHLESIFIKIFSIRCSQMPSKKIKPPSSARNQKMQELQWYSAAFPFSNFNWLSDKSCSLRINNQNFLIIEQKQCFFVVQEVNNRLVSYRISEMDNKKRFKTDGYSTQIEYFDSLKSLDMFQSKDQNSQDLQRNKIPISKIQYKTMDKFLAQTSTQQKHIIKSNTQDNIVFPSIKMTVSQQSKQQYEQACSQKLKQDQLIAQMKRNQSKNQKIPKLVLHDQFRNSVKFNSPSAHNFGIPVMYSERISSQKEQKKSESKNKLKKNPESKEQSNLQTIKQSFESTNRNNFIYQSLSPNQAPPFLKIEKVKTKKRIPKFLTKKNGEQVDYAHSSSQPKADFSPTYKQIHGKQEKRDQKPILLSYKSIGNLLLNVPNIQKKLQTPQKKPVIQLQQVKQMKCADNIIKNNEN